MDSFRVPFKLCNSDSHVSGTLTSSIDLQIRGVSDGVNCCMVSVCGLMGHAPELVARLLGMPPFLFGLGLTTCKDIQLGQQSLLLSLRLLLKHVVALLLQGLFTGEDLLFRCKLLAPHGFAMHMFCTEVFGVLIQKRVLLFS